MKNYDWSVTVNYNLNCLYIPYHPYRILIIGGSGSGKTALLNTIKDQISTKLTYRLDIPLHQSINYLLMEEKNHELKK